jgi:uncharacterized iron-regulated membrane protein
MRKRIKDIVLLLHRWLGICSGLVVIIVALTGASMSFQEEYQNRFQRSFYNADYKGRQLLSLNVLCDSVHQYYPKEAITDIRFKATDNAAFIFHTKSKLISVNPATGGIQSIKDKNKDLYTVILKLHTELLLGEIGEEIVKWNVFIFFLICFSGLILWWPKKWKYFRQSASLRLQLKNRKLFNRQLHTVLGFYALCVLTIIAITGMFWKFENVKKLVALATVQNVNAIKDKNVKLKAEETSLLYLNEVYRQAISQYPGAREIQVKPPQKGNAVIRIVMRYPYKWLRKQNTLYYSSIDGELLKEDLYKNYNSYDQFARSNFDLHTGRIKALGLWSKTAYFLAALIAAMLPVTGFIMWRSRSKKKDKARTSSHFPKRVPAPVLQING